MDIGNAFLIVNPNARKGKGREDGEKIVSYFRERGIDIPWRYTSAPGDAWKITKDAIAEGCDTIIVAGGDGALNEVVNGIMFSGREVRLGLVPIGRGNDYAFSLGIPGSLYGALDVILSGKTRKVDVGLVEKDGGKVRYFLNGNGYGFEPMVNFRAMEYKHLNGIASYVVAFLEMMVHVPPAFKVEIELDGDVVELETQQISFTLGKRMGSCFMLAPNASIDDGMFDFLATKRPLGRLSLVSAVLKFLKGTHVDDKRNFLIKNVHSGVIRVSSGDIYSHADGEVVALGEGKIFKVSIIERGLSMFSV